MVVTVVFFAFMFTTVIIDVILFNYTKVVLEGQWNEIIFEGKTSIIVLIHSLTNIIPLFIFIFVLIFVLFRFILVNVDGLKEVKKGITFDNYGDIGLLASLLLLLLFLHFGGVAASGPFNCTAFAFVNNIAVRHMVLFCECGVLEVGVGLKFKSQSKSLVLFRQLKSDIL